jgi:hypothetical protein
MKKSANQFEVINALRSKCQDLVAASGSLNQAVKALAGLEKKYAEACELLGVESFGLKSVCAAWSSELMVEVDGRKCLGLYVPTQVLVEGTDDEGQPIQKNAYERKEGKKGVTFKALKVRKLQVPAKWTPALIVEGLVQSAQIELAKLEAEVSEMHAENQLREGVWVKNTEKDSETGSTSISFVKA